MRKNNKHRSFGKNTDNAEHETLEVDNIDDIASDDNARTTNGLLEEFPNKDSVEFKPKFVERYSKLTNFEEFKRYSLSFPRRAIRVNTLKISIPEVQRRLESDWELIQVPWCRKAFGYGIPKMEEGILATLKNIL